MRPGDSTTTAKIADIFAGIFGRMGICQSCDAVTAMSTAKVVMPDGKLAEFRQPARASEVLERSPGCFICDADDLDFGGEVLAVDDDEELRPGQLYFALPLRWLRHPLEAEEMAALAVKASSALGNAGGRRPCCASRRTSVVVPAAVSRRERMSRSEIGGSGAMVEERRKRRRPGAGGGGRKFDVKLSAIPE